MEKAHRCGLLKAKPNMKVWMDGIKINFLRKSNASGFKFLALNVF